MLDPATYADLIQRHAAVIRTPPLLDLDADAVTGEIRVKINLEFLPHPILGNTRLRVRETYDATGVLVRYRYCWETSSKPTGNISAWENEHGHGLATDPHHHHPVLFNRKPVRENHNVRSLESAMAFVMAYLRSGQGYP